MQNIPGIVHQLTPISAHSKHTSHLPESETRPIPDELRLYCKNEGTIGELTATSRRSQPLLLSRLHPATSSILFRKVQRFLEPNTEHVKQRLSVEKRGKRTPGGLGVEAHRERDIWLQNTRRVCHKSRGGMFSRLSRRLPFMSLLRSAASFGRAEPVHTT